MHPIFNVDLLKPYHPPFLDTSIIEEHLDISKLNLENFSLVKENHIVDTWIKPTKGCPIYLYWVIKKGNPSHQGN